MKQIKAKKNPFAGSVLLERVYLLAEKHHRGQLRKGGLPYITHPVSVALELMKVGYGEKIAAAALLHDVLEDTGCEYEEILRVAGAQITRWVVQITDRDKCVPWPVRKRNYLKALKSADKEALTVACADKADNMRGLLTGLKNEGNGFGKNFSAKLPDKFKNYENIYKIIRKRHPACRVLPQYAELLNQIKSGVS